MDPGRHVNPIHRWHDCPHSPGRADQHRRLGYGQGPGLTMVASARERPRRPTLPRGEGPRPAATTPTAPRCTTRLPWLEATVLSTAHQYPKTTLLVAERLAPSP